MIRIEYSAKGYVVQHYVRSIEFGDHVTFRGLGSRG